MSGVLDVEGLTNAAEIGRGGFAVVYRAEQPALARRVAVKVLTSRLDGPARERFEREGHALGRLSGHPNIVDVYSTGVTTDDRPFITMAYVPGGSLGDRVRERGPLSWPEAVRVGAALADALETAHARGMLHRDVKPDNVLLGEQGQPMLADFGIARVEGRFETSAAQTFASLAYAAPEVLDGRAPTAAADVYSLAATLVAALTGDPPFPRGGEESLAALYVRIATAPPPDLRPRGVPDAVCRALEAALAKDPAARPATARAFGDLLRALDPEVTEDAPLGAAPVAAPAAAPAAGQAAGQAAPAAPPSRRRRHRSVLAGVSGALVLAGAAAAALALRGGEERDASPIEKLAGFWTGTATSGSAEFGVELDVGRGCVVDGPCGTIKVTHVPCHGHISLLQVLADGTVEFDVGDFLPGSNREECHPGAGDFFKLQDDGTLAYTTSYDESIRGTLRRAG